MVFTGALSDEGTKPRVKRKDFQDIPFVGGDPTSVDPSPWDKGQVLGECLRIRVTDFIQSTPLLRVDGSVNPLWAHELSLAFPKLVEHEIDNLLELLRQEQEKITELMLDTTREIFDEPSLFDKVASQVHPQVRYEKESDALYVMIHGNWLLYVPGLESRA